MKRRNFVKSCLVAPFVWLLRGKKEEYSCSASMSGHPSATNTVEPEFYKELQFGESFDGRIVSMTQFQGDLWVATERRVYMIKERERYGL